MLPENVTAVIARNEIWRGEPGRGESATEPYECGWAREAVFFVRALKPPTLPEGAVARVQMSPDGMRWLDEGTTLILPQAQDTQGFARVARFGGWLRLAASLPDGAEITVLVTLHLKA